MTLEQLLFSRDARNVRQAELLRQFAGRTLVCLTVVLPGSVKRDKRSLRIAEAGVAAVRAEFSPVFEELRDLETGFEGFFIVDGGAWEVKRRCCRIEDTHPLGRLMDIDVLEDRDGFPVPLGRRVLALPQRPCILCGAPVRICMRTRAHTPEELLLKIDEILKNTANS